MIPVAQAAGPGWPLWLQLVVFLSLAAVITVLLSLVLGRPQWLYATWRLHRYLRRRPCGKCHLCKCSDSEISLRAENMEYQERKRTGPDA